MESEIGTDKAFTSEFQAFLLSVETQQSQAIFERVFSVLNQHVSDFISNPPLTLANQIDSCATTWKAFVLNLSETS